MMEKSAQPGEGGGCTPTHFHYVYHHVQSCGVRSSEGRSTQWVRRLEGWTNTAARLACWRRVTRQVVDGPYHLPFPYRTGCPGAAQLRADGISSCCNIINVHNQPSRKDGMAWYSSTLPLFQLYHYMYSVVQAISPSVCICFSASAVCLFAPLDASDFFNFGQFENLSVRTLSLFSSLYNQSDNQLYTYLSNS